LPTKSLAVCCEALHSSFCAALFLPDEQSDIVNKTFQKITDEDTIYIPFLWWYEIANVLTVSVKRKRLKYADIININQLLYSYKFITDSNSGVDYTEKLLELAHTYELSAYDAAYLELAIRKEGVVGTLDGNLRNACIKYGLTVL
jgi:predicted nucleic acid-binding protein